MRFPRRVAWVGSCLASSAVLAAGCASPVGDEGVPVSAQPTGSSISSVAPQPRATGGVPSGAALASVDLCQLLTSEQLASLNLGMPTPSPDVMTGAGTSAGCSWREPFGGDPNWVLVTVLRFDFNELALTGQFAQSELSDYPILVQEDVGLSRCELLADASPGEILLGRHDGSDAPASCVRLREVMEPVLQTLRETL